MQNSNTNIRIFDPLTDVIEVTRIGAVYDESILIEANDLIKVITIPTPRIWARNKLTQLQSGTDITTITGTWAVPEIYAQNFSPDDSAWRKYNPTYELVVHKLVKKKSGSNLRGYKWVHPVNNKAGATGKKFAGGQTYSDSSGGTWDDRQTEWPVDVSTKETFLKLLDPHKFLSLNGTPASVAGADPLTGTWEEQLFLQKTYFAPKNSNGTKHKMAFAVRIRIDNPNFKPGVPNQDPYLYGDASNILVFRPKLYNLWDGSTNDFQGNPVNSHYFFDWVATEENSAQN